MKIKDILAFLAGGLIIIGVFSFGVVMSNMDREIPVWKSESSIGQSSNKLEEETITAMETREVEAESETVIENNNKEAQIVQEDDGLKIVKFYDSVSMDPTGKTRLAESVSFEPIEDHVIEYYKKYFKNDKEVHVIINKYLNTTTNIFCMVDGLLLDVSVHEYVDGEEASAKTLCAGALLREYHVNVITGETEEIDLGE